MSLMSSYDGHLIPICKAKVKVSVPSSLHCLPITRRISRYDSRSGQFSLEQSNHPMVECIR